METFKKNFGIVVFYALAFSIIALVVMYGQMK